MPSRPEDMDQGLARSHISSLEWQKAVSEDMILPCTYYLYHDKTMNYDHLPLTII